MHGCAAPAAAAVALAAAIYCCAAWARAEVACISSDIGSMQWWLRWYSLSSWVSLLVVVAAWYVICLMFMLSVMGLVK
jgi:hypothetical protein